MIEHRKNNRVDEFDKAMTEAAQRVNSNCLKKLVVDETNKKFCVIDEEIENWYRKQRAKALSDLVSSDKKEDEFNLGCDSAHNIEDENGHCVVYWTAGKKLCSGYFDENGKLHRTDGTIEPQGFFNKTKEFVKNMMCDFGVKV